MQVEKKIFCHWDLVRFVKEETLRQEDGNLATLSITNGKRTELMIFLGQDDSKSRYEVRVYKNKPSDKYVPKNNDRVESFEENDEYATFFFTRFDQALHFTDWIGYVHPEYRIRPEI